MTEQEISDVVMAYATGATIQAVRKASADDLWCSIANPPSWNFEDYDYRIKPEPPKLMEQWINVYTDHVSAPYDTKANADEGASVDRIACKHLREVTND